MGPMVKQLPISVGGAKKSDVRAQFAALCYRVVKDKVQVLVISSRGTGRWILPKGWPMDGKTPAEAALQEAWEEAGVIGKVVSAPLGLYSYQKVQDHAHDFPCIAVVYAVKVKSLSKDFPEAGERRVKWVGRKKAAKLVDEPELSQILRDFDPRKAS
jgi:8-oxo-dGTP pyrophosphatase MutT (NUDIX family)